MESKNTSLKKHLKSKHLTMIAIGGCIGTGLFMASGEAIHEAGPGGALVAYSLIGIMVYFLMTSLGEMATYLPVSGSLSTYASKYVDPSLGFALGWNYWLNWVITVAVDVNIASLVVHYWDIMQFLPQWGWSIIFFIVIIALNSLSVKFFGESEFWFAFIKVITIIIFLILGVLTIFGILGGEFIGFKNLMIKDAPFLGNGFFDHFITIVGVFIIAGFSFQGTELIGVTAGESENPEKDIPKSIKQVFWRILLFYIFTILIISLIIPYYSPKLLGADVNEIATSPFTLVLEKSGILFAATIMNTVILTSIVSSANSGFYASIRMLYALAIEKQAYKKFAITNKFGVPMYALIATSIIILLMILIYIYDSKAIKYMFNSSGIIGFIAWLGIAISHYRFRMAFIKQNKDLSVLKFRAKLFPFGQFLSIILCILIIICQDTNLILHGEFNALSLTISYIGIPVFILFYLYHKIKYKTKIIKLKNIEL